MSEPLCILGADKLFLTEVENCGVGDGGFFTERNVPFQGAQIQSALLRMV